ncbi:hypothetical protein L9F63_018070, partial [Diploptera punctata]
CECSNERNCAIMTANKQEYPKATNALVFGGMLTYIAGLMLMMSFASPYWIQSYQETYSNFKHMGLWEYCFDEFRYPYYQFDKQFDGCHYIFSQEYYVIREWLLPGWLMVVQAFVTLGLMLSFSSQIIIACELIRLPLEFVLLMSGCCQALHSSVMLLHDTRKMWELRKESRNLVVQMHPNPGRNGFV